MHIGIYFYPWYCPRRWRETSRLLTSEKGEYDSTDAEIARWQADHLARCGFDYVIFELVPMADWGFDTIDRAIAGMIPLLRERRLHWSFLMDAYVAADPAAALPEMQALIRHLEQRGWTDGLVTGPTGRPLLLCFFPVPQLALGLTRAQPAYEIRYPAYFPEWDDPDADLDLFYMAPWKECRAFARASGKTLFDALAPAGYVSFFETSFRKRRFDGFASAVPAFDDRHQNRDVRAVPILPVLPADDGARIRRELEGAAATGADHIIVYGWNEYFENAVIEPTREQGPLLFESCRQTIAALRRR